MLGHCKRSAEPLSRSEPVSTDGRGGGLEMASTCRNSGAPSRTRTDTVRILSPLPYGFAVTHLREPIPALIPLFSTAFG
jgi:hypothetical protein